MEPLLQQHDSKYFAHRPLPESWVGVTRSKFKFLKKLGHVVYQIKWNHECSNVVASILPPESHPLTQGIGSKGQLSSFPECHVAYQIKGNQVCSNMVANIFSRRPPPTPLPLGDRVKRSNFNFFRTWSCCISN